jgi:hypothetical protein
MIVYKTEEARLGDPVFNRMVEVMGGTLSHGHRGATYTIPEPMKFPTIKLVKVDDFDRYKNVWGRFKAESYLQNAQLPTGEWATFRAYLADQMSMAGRGFLVAEVYSGPRTGERVVWTFGPCDHDFEHRSGGNCYHIYTCKKCGARYDVDSSD